jgi:ferredoxin
MQLKVSKIIRGIDENNLAAIRELHPERCIQCGTCTYFCHTGKNVMKAVASVKGEVK